METSIHWTQRRGPLEPNFALVYVKTTVIGMIWMSDVEMGKVYAVRPGRFEHVRDFRNVAEAVRYLADPYMPVSAIIEIIEISDNRIVGHTQVAA
jgi:hypothetical protein